MPKRPREHELEDISRHKLRGLLPSAWVVRTIVEEYGIDLEVEIFDNGQATGLTFRVQLKATDKAPRRGRISRSGIKSSSLNYWRSLDVPVLVALYSTPANSFYVRWAHSYDAHYSRNPDSKTITFAFKPEDQLSPEFISRIPASVAFIRAATRRSLPLPVPVTVALTQELQGHSARRIRALFREAVGRVPELLEFSDNEYLSIEVSADDATLKCTLPTALRTTSFHFEPDTYANPNGAGLFVGDSLIAIANLLLAVGEGRGAAILLKEFRNQSQALTTPGTREIFLSRYLEQGQVRDAFELVEDWIAAPDDVHRDFAEFALLQIFVSPDSNSLSRAESQRMMSLLLERADLERRGGQTAKAGVTLYNLGEMCRANEQWDLALESFDLAMSTNQSYRKRAYFWRARASVLFQLDRLTEAAVDYQTALDLGGVPEAAFLLSDTLMRDGQFAAAEAVPMRSSAVDFYALGERMNRRVLATLREIVGLEHQRRRDVPDDVIAQSVDGATREAVLQAMKDFDALDPRLWHLLAGVDAREESYEASLSAIAVAADLRREDPHLWALAALLAVVTTAPDQDLDDYCDSGLKWCGPDFLDAIEDATAVDGMSDDVAATIRERVYDRAEADRPRWPVVVRLVDPDGNFEVLAVDR